MFSLEGKHNTKMEPSSTPRLLLLLLAYLLVNLPALVVAQPDFSLQWCYNDRGNYTNSSTYQTNLNTLLSSLASDTENESGFYNLTVGQVSSIALCRGDTPLDVCRSCIYNSTVKILQVCPNQKEAFGVYDLCMLRYSNRTVMGDMQTRPVVVAYNTANATDVDTFSQSVRELMGKLRTRAMSGSSIKKFATGENLTSQDFYTIYGMVQCTPDLSSRQCDDCLTSNYRDSLQFQTKVGGIVMGPSCQYRYETYSFYSNPPPPPPSPPPPPVASPLDPPSPEGKKGKKVPTVVIIIVSTVSAVLVVVCIWIFIFLRGRKPRELLLKDGNDDDDMRSAELVFDFNTISVATDNFSEENKLGQGGFGAVYKGTLSDGQEVAVKRLSKNSGQGDIEFKNEVLLVAKLQHRNLVRLLGFCIQGSERLLVYEFVPNASLDHFIFEYAMHGQFSLKSDVFSFGVLILEIVSGQKNSSFRNGDTGDYLLSFDNVADRPTMASVVLMLSSLSLTLQIPSQPPFSVHSNVQSDVSSSLGYDNSRATDPSESDSVALPLSRNDVTISELFPR
ncbi:hypothetical protein Tsubulata_027346 [Turnera subulata]|uniref:Uncharacterized protein n=1 Tax=Turnera subulata TaxID=218843 RepID=A0A9Q0G215_9ROSI|nr:hypothetical protein Tsubulata_027346 [Turnera subulata]